MSPMYFIELCNDDGISILLSTQIYTNIVYLLSAADSNLQFIENKYFR